ncbi:hypothetical protein B9Z19DRAFT_447619 [Tuber borchii]|uniref:Uncharacterized protein n=1 Tax=Tuber borchii TaxID=42251 RepID=A0A2T7A8Z4_TUBBO|nr:hypothetical protein B9Z19DRAFT_447619 [Tuber borchii]
MVQRSYSLIELPLIVNDMISSSGSGYEFRALESASMSRGGNTEEKPDSDLAGAYNGNRIFRYIFPITYKVPSISRPSQIVAILSMVSPSH